MQQSNTQQQQKPRKNKYEFTLDRGRKIYIDSDFDSGNIGLIRQVTQLQYRLEAVSDSKLSSNANNNSENNNKNSNVNNNNNNHNNGKKTWFHFKISAPKNIRVRLIIQNVSIYENMYQDKDWAKPVMNDGSGNGWREVKDCFLTYRGEVGIIIDYTFSSQKFVFFAMTVPFSYEDNQNFVKELAFKIPEHIQYSDQIIGKSYGGLNLHLLRFTSKQLKNTKQPGNSSSISNILQNSQLQKPQKKSNPRVHSQASIDRTIQPVISLQSYNNNNNINNNFNPKKPIIFITSRVHPGEVGSSHCLLGIIDFLLQGNSLQAYLILKMFQIMIIPIVNPDGVYDGNYRMDLNNTNLNRVYQQPSEDQHPTVYKIKQLIQSLVNPTSSSSNNNNNNTNNNNNDKLSQQLQPRKIMFHFDLHSHSCIKPAFIYGNAFDQIVTQTQSELFCRVLENNCAYFRYGLSHFGEKHMKMKDKGEILSKQGCARVVISKMANVVYSYTVQTSIFPYPQSEPIPQPLPSSCSIFKISQHPLLPQRDLTYTQINPQQIFNKYNIKNQLVLDNMNLGYSIMISILDILQKNPYMRQIIGVEEGLDGIRKQISQGLLQSQERFKLLDMKAYQKVRNIAKYCKDQITSKNQKCWDYLANDKILSSIKWPPCFKMFQSSSNNFDLDANRRRNRTKTQISQSQRQVNQFINPRNMRKRLLNLQTAQNNQQCLNNNGQQQQQSVKNTKTLQNQPVSPSKSTLSPRHVQIQFDIKPTTTINTGTGGQQQNHHGHSLHSNTNTNSNTNHILPQIRRSLQRNTNSNNSNKIKISSYTNNNNKNVQQQQQISAAQLKQMKEMKQLKQLKQKQSTKNIVLSFIHQQMQKINTIRKNVQKSMAVQSRLASYKLVKKSTKSSKALANIGSINMAANHRYQAYNNNNNVGNNNNNCQLSQRVIYDHGQRDRQGDRKIKRSISRKKLTNNKNNGDQYQAIISTRRRNHTCIQQDQQQQFQQQQGIYYVDQNNHQLDQKQLQIIQKSQKRRYTQQSQQSHSHSHHIHHQIPATKPRPPRMPASLQKISQYPLYPLPIPISIQKQKDNIAIVVGNKRELAKVKYSQIKKKNIIRQDISNNINSIYNNNNNNGNNNGNNSNNNMVRLPQLRGVAANSSNNHNHNQSRNAGYSDNSTGEQTNNNNNNGQNNGNGKSGKNGLSINLNLNFNVNLQIESAVREITGRARAATVPDQL